MDSTLAQRMGRIKPSPTLAVTARRPYRRHERLVGIWPRNPVGSVLFRQETALVGICGHREKGGVQHHRQKRQMT